ncbi:hypothetical protein HY988_06380 [Candidatus Micrarchaeota archaeon]|nr:hypothetical protein [Candidatus Micrarchaeota archaeon]
MSGSPQSPQRVRENPYEQDMKKVLAEIADLARGAEAVAQAPEVRAKITGYTELLSKAAKVQVKNPKTKWFGEQALSAIKEGRLDVAGFAISVGMLLPLLNEDEKKKFQSRFQTIVENRTPLTPEMLAQFSKEVAYSEYSEQAAGLRASLSNWGKGLTRQKALAEKVLRTAEELARKGEFVYADHGMGFAITYVASIEEFGVRKGNKIDSVSLGFKGSVMEEMLADYASENWEIPQGKEGERKEEKLAEKWAAKEETFDKGVSRNIDICNALTDYYNMKKIYEGASGYEEKIHKTDSRLKGGTTLKELLRNAHLAAIKGDLRGYSEERKRIILRGNLVADAARAQDIEAIKKGIDNGLGQMSSILLSGWKGKKQLAAPFEIVGDTLPFPYPISVDRFGEITRYEDTPDFKKLDPMLRSEWEHLFKQVHQFSAKIAGLKPDEKIPYDEYRELIRQSVELKRKTVGLQIMDGELTRHEAYYRALNKEHFAGQSYKALDYLADSKSRLDAAVGFLRAGKFEEAEKLYSLAIKARRQALQIYGAPNFESGAVEKTTLLEQGRMLSATLGIDMKAEDWVRYLYNFKPDLEAYERIHTDAMHNILFGIIDGEDLQRRFKGTKLIETAIFATPAHSITPLGGMAEHEKAVVWLVLAGVGGAGTFGPFSPKGGGGSGGGPKFKIEGAEIGTLAAESGGKETSIDTLNEATKILQQMEKEAEKAKFAGKVALIAATIGSGFIPVVGPWISGALIIGTTTDDVVTEYEATGKVSNETWANVAITAALVGAGATAGALKALKAAENVTVSAEQIAKGMGWLYTLKMTGDALELQANSNELYAKAEGEVDEVRRRELINEADSLRREAYLQYGMAGVGVAHSIANRISRYWRMRAVRASLLEEQMANLGIVKPEVRAYEAPTKGAILNDTATLQDYLSALSGRKGADAQKAAQGRLEEMVPEMRRRMEIWANNKQLMDALGSEQGLDANSFLGRRFENDLKDLRGKVRIVDEPAEQAARAAAGGGTTPEGQFTDLRGQIIPTRTGEVPPEQVGAQGTRAGRVGRAVGGTLKTVGGWFMKDSTAAPPEVKQVASIPEGKGPKGAEPAEAGKTEAEIAAARAREQTIDPTKEIADKFLKEHKGECVASLEEMRRANPQEFEKLTQELARRATDPQEKDPSSYREILATLYAKSKAGFGLDAAREARDIINAAAKQRSARAGRAVEAKAIEDEYRAKTLSEGQVKALLEARPSLVGDVFKTITVEERAAVDGQLGKAGALKPAEIAQRYDDAVGNLRRSMSTRAEGETLAALYAKSGEIGVDLPAQAKELAEKTIKDEARARGVNPREVTQEYQAKPLTEEQVKALMERNPELLAQMLPRMDPNDAAVLRGAPAVGEAGETVGNERRAIIDHYSREIARLNNSRAVETGQRPDNLFADLRQKADSGNIGAGGFNGAVSEYLGSEALGKDIEGKVKVGEDGKPARTALKALVGEGTVAADCAKALGEPNRAANAIIGARLNALVDGVDVTADAKARYKTAITNVIEGGTRSFIDSERGGAIRDIGRLLDEVHSEALRLAAGDKAAGADGKGQVVDPSKIERIGNKINEAGKASGPNPSEVVGEANGFVDYTRRLSNQIKINAQFSVEFNAASHLKSATEGPSGTGPTAPGYTRKLTWKRVTKVGLGAAGVATLGVGLYTIGLGGIAAVGVPAAIGYAGWRGFKASPSRGRAFFRGGGWPYAYFLPAAMSLAWPAYHFGLDPEYERKEKMAEAWGLEEKGGISDRFGSYRIPLPNRGEGEKYVWMLPTEPLKRETLQPSDKGKLDLQIGDTNIYVIDPRPAFLAATGAGKILGINDKFAELQGPAVKAEKKAEVEAGFTKDLTAASITKDDVLLATAHRKAEAVMLREVRFVEVKDDIEELNAARKAETEKRGALAAAREETERKEKGKEAGHPESGSKIEKLAKELHDAVKRSDDAFAKLQKDFPYLGAILEQQIAYIDLEKLNRYANLPKPEAEGYVKETLGIFGLNYADVSGRTFDRGSLLAVIRAQGEIPTLDVQTVRGTLAQKFYRGYLQDPLMNGQVKGYPMTAALTEYINQKRKLNPDSKFDLEDLKYFSAFSNQMVARQALLRGYDGMVLKFCISTGIVQMQGKVPVVGSQQEEDIKFLRTHPQLFRILYAEGVLGGHIPQSYMADAVANLRKSTPAETADGIRKQLEVAGLYLENPLASTNTYSFLAAMDNRATQHPEFRAAFKALVDEYKVSEADTARLMENYKLKVANWAKLNGLDGFALGADPNNAQMVYGNPRDLASEIIGSDSAKAMEKAKAKGLVGPSLLAELDPKMLDHPELVALANDPRFGQGLVKAIIAEKDKFDAPGKLVLALLKLLGSGTETWGRGNVEKEVKRIFDSIEQLKVKAPKPSAPQAVQLRLAPLNPTYILPGGLAISRAGDSLGLYEVSKGAAITPRIREYFNSGLSENGWLLKAIGTDTKLREVLKEKAGSIAPGIVEQQIYDTIYRHAAAARGAGQYHVPKTAQKGEQDNTPQVLKDIGIRVKATEGGGLELELTIPEEKTDRVAHVKALLTAPLPTGTSAQGAAPAQAPTPAPTFGKSEEQKQVEADAFFKKNISSKVRLRIENLLAKAPFKNSLGADEGEQRKTARKLIYFEIVLKHPDPKELYDRYGIHIKEGHGEDAKIDGLEPSESALKTKGDNLRRDAVKK